MLRQEERIYDKNVPAFLRAFRIALSEATFSKGHVHDLATDELTEALLVAEHGDHIDMKRAYHCVDWTFRTMMPLLLREEGFAEKADLLQAHPPLLDIREVDSMEVLLQSIDLGDPDLSSDTDWSVFTCNMALNSAEAILTMVLLAAIGWVKEALATM